MSILTAHNLGKSFGQDDIFDDITLEIPHGARIALVGPNGAGKTTLLNLLIGEDVPTTGTVAIAKGTRIGFLPQRPHIAGGHTLWQEQLGAFGALRTMEAELNALAERLADDPDALDEYGRRQEAFELAGGYTYESRIRMVLQGVGFRDEQFHTPLEQLSGGQKTRALLARLLLSEPDLLVLDEPTNHLDIDAVEWLEHYLKDFPGAVLVVSHDRYFMDNFANVIWELEYGTLEVYRGNYTHYLQQRQERHERLLKEFEAQQAFIAKEEEYIRRNMAGQNTRQAKGRLKRLETMKRNGRILARPRGKRREMSLKLRAQIRSGDKVLMTHGLTVGYPQLRLFDVPDITLYRGEVVGLIGANGTGKTTFLRTIIEGLPPLAGSVTLGAGVQIGYFAQAHESLNPANSILDEIGTVRAMPPAEARNYLAQFLFTGDDVFRPIGTLSGGERGRVALAKLALTGANLLLLDEPTNHLDIDSQEVLQTVLADFSGTILLVTHDRYLVDALATQIWATRRGGLTVFEGSYREYLAERARLQQQEALTHAATSASGKPASPPPKPEPARKAGLTPFQLQRRVAELEARIHELEARLSQLEDEIADASAQGDAARVSVLGEDYNRTEHDLDEAMTEWSALLS